MVYLKRLDGTVFGKDNPSKMVVLCAIAMGIHQKKLKKQSMKFTAQNKIKFSAGDNFKILGNVKCLV